MYCCDKEDQWRCRRCRRLIFWQLVRTEHYAYGDYDHYCKNYCEWNMCSNVLDQCSALKEEHVYTVYGKVYNECSSCNNKC